MATVTLTIDGRPITVEKGTTVLQAAIEHGIHVPYYCYHPGIGIEGSCRVCLVKVEKMPKLQTACSTLCADGMVVHTGTPDVVEARASVFEFLLINHPLDCPVCDKGGECPLQDFSYTFGPSRSRMDFERRTFDGEGVRADVDFGPTLMLNRNRCILCTRCVRFMRDIDGDAQISIVDRGYGSEIATFQETGVHSLLSGNLADICPVGAITTKDYRFKARPWDNPHVVDTICTFCARGCHTAVWVRGKPEWAKADRLVRITPRYAPEVNGYWMCDIGRFDYRWVESDERLRQPLVRQPDGTLQPVGWREAMAALARELPPRERSSRLRLLVSAHASLEELFLVRQVSAALGSADAVTVSWRYREKAQPARTTFRVPPVDAPNVTGARDLGLPVGDGAHPDTAAIHAAVAAGAVQSLYVVDPGPEGSIGDVSWILDARRRGALPHLIVQGVLATELARAADLVLPGATAFEKEAAYTNAQGLVQASARVLAPPGEAVEDWQILAALARALGVPVAYRDAGEIRRAIADALGDHPAYRALPALRFGTPTPVRTWLQASNPSERWKWDVFFQDRPPLKWAGEPAPPRCLEVVPLVRTEE
jgi:NADH-quinone oxidoreductase subunit G